MTRRINPPRLSFETIDKFYGIASDREGEEQRTREFYDLQNVYNNFMEGLQCRGGSEKVFNITDNSGSKTYGVHTLLDDSGNQIYLKMANANLYKSTGSTWSSITSGLTNANTFFTDLSGKEIGGSSLDTGTIEASTSVTVTDTDATFTVNEHVGNILSINGEEKLITANTDTRIFVGERFDNTPDSGSTYNIYNRSSCAYFANGTTYYKTDGTSATQLDTSDYAYSFSVIETHLGRVFGANGTRLHWSDLGNGDHFSRNAYRDFDTPIIQIKSFGQVLVIYERNRVSVQYGDNPDNFQWLVLIPNKGCVAPKSVCNYAGVYQFFLSDEGVFILSKDKLQSRAEGIEPTSVSRNYIQKQLDAISDADKAEACAEVHREQLWICLGDSWYCLHVQGSGEADFIAWVWTRHDYPTALDANVLGHFGTKFVAGSAASGQVYEIDRRDLTDDDGSDIEMIIEKRNWYITGVGDEKRYWSFHCQQNSTAVTENVVWYFADQDDNYGTAIQTVDLNAIGSKRHYEVRIPGNPSDPKHISELCSFKIVMDSANEKPAIKQIQLRYYPYVYS